VEALIATKQPKRYDAAVALLRDLRELAVRTGRRDEADDRIRQLVERHAKKATLIDRLRAAGLIGAVAAEG
jgi:uncharacterized Zn finger protein